MDQKGSSELDTKEFSEVFIKLCEEHKALWFSSLARIQTFYHDTRFPYRKKTWELYLF
jgi:hypothetical protein